MPRCDRRLRGSEIGEEADDEPQPTPPMQGLRWATILLSAAGLLVLLASLTSAFHLSIGASDAVGVSPEETPRDPSISQRWHDVGTARAHTCYAPDPQVPDNTVDELEAAISEEGFCGKLTYEPGTLFERPSRPDQDLRSPIGMFDATFVTYVGTHQLQTCVPWCAEPGGGVLYDAVHTTGASAGLTPGAEEAHDRWRHHEFGVNLAVPNPTLAVHENTGLHPMNGWIFPVHDQTIVAYLYDDSGRAVDDQRLEDILAERDLPLQAVPKVCGFTPDADIEPLTPPSSACEVEFRWIGDGDTDDPSSPCSSDTYLCAAFQEHWQARVTCVMAATSCGAPATTASPTDPQIDSPLLETGWVSERANQVERLAGVEPGGLVNPPSTDPSDPRFWNPGTVAPATRSVVPNGWFASSDPPAAADSTLEYVRWHFVVAPAISPCNGSVEPGFSFRAPIGGGIPYLAHDLDVFTPVGHLDLHDGTSGFTNVRDWGASLARDIAGQGDDELPDLGEVGGGTSLPIESVPRYVTKPWIPEPNAEGDTSKEHVRVSRDNPCTRIQGTPEAPRTQDPWVDIVDNRVTKTTQGVGAYGNDRQDHSAGNRPGPGWFTAEGMVGVFADPDDDGAYEQAPPSDLFAGIFEHGAYPMFWDMRLDGDGQIATDAGCQMNGRPLTGMMQEAGYGPRTGVIQIVLLREGADWYFRDQPHDLEHENVAGAGYLLGRGESPGQPAPNAYLFMSQALWHLYDRGDSAVHAAVGEMLAQLPVETYDLWPSTEMADPQGGARSDFHPQCEEGTGGFVSRWSFSHHCLDREPADCSGDTVVTAYLYENTNRDDVLGGGSIPPFQPTGAEPYDGFDGSGPGELWLDVDPLDNDPDRNTHDGSPPT